MNVAKLTCALLLATLAAMAGAADWQGAQDRADALKRQFPQSDTLVVAQCWIDVARHEALRNDASDFAAQATEQADRLIDELASGRLQPPADDGLRAAAQSLRPDLWRELAALRDAPGGRCVAARITCAEVALIHAHHEYAQFGWRHANPYIAEAEDRIATARADAMRCAPR